MTYTLLHKNLWLCSLTEDQHAQTCDYWYTVTSDGGTPHTAFRTRAALEQWLADRGLRIDGEIPATGTSAGLRIIGAYRAALHMSYDAFYALGGARRRGLSNGRYTLAIVTTDTDGMRTEHMLNPNCRDRPEYNYAESVALIDSGNAAMLK